MDNIFFLPAHELARRVRKKELSCAELVTASLRRIEALNPRLNAFTSVDATGATNAARAADVSLSRSADIPPLFGVPISIKSCIDVAGLRSEAGSRLRQRYTAATDAVLVQRLKNAGAIVIGMTNTPEMLLAYETDNLLYGATSNPWDVTRTAGGSSGGEAAAIASGMSAAGIGSDGGGSVRVPAHFTGICALKPTPGRIPGSGHFPECVGPWAFMGVVGPMARSVEDLRVMFRAMAGADDGDPMSAPVATRSNAMSVRGARIGIMEGDSTVSEEARQAVRKAAKALEEQGAVVELFQMPGLERALEIWRMIFVSAADVMIRWIGTDVSMLSPIVRDFLEYAATLPPLTTHALLSGLIERDQLRAAALRAMRPYTAVLTPVSTGPAFRHGEGGWGGKHPSDYIRTMRYAQIANVLGLPAAVAPVSHDVLPIGVQVLGRAYEDEAVLDVTAAIESRFGFVPPPQP